MHKENNNSWRQKIATEADETAQTEISLEEFFVAAKAQAELEESAEAAIADDSKKLFQHLFGQDDELDALLAGSQKEIGVLFDAIFPADETCKTGAE